jgi:quinolinate synthase
MLSYAEQLERMAGGASEDGPAAPSSIVAKDVAGDVDGEWGGSHEQTQGDPNEAIVATETGMLYPLRMAAPDVEFIPANPKAQCVYMKMITLPKLRDALRDMKYEVRVPAEIAERARIPIDRMVAIG